MKTINLILILLIFYFYISEPGIVPNSDYPNKTLRANSTLEEPSEKETEQKTEKKEIYEVEHLINAAKEGNIKAIKKFLKSTRMDINARDESGDAAIHYATGHFAGPDADHIKLVSHINIVKLLLKNNADVNLKDHNGDSPLILASYFCDMDMIQLLLDHSATVDLENNEGNNALHGSVRCPLPVAKLLVENGVPLSQKNIEGKTPLALAKEVKNINMVSYLISQGAR
ncbi:MAG: ankyrin repeat domain-containing protein [Leptospiraceae bacterium]|nr:ankyrin repeat domain-containing protein [Leptospiraceae bacterium]